jgi:uncharacterized protein with HEPN domain
MAGRDERLSLADIRDAIQRALSYTARGRAAFFADPMTQDAVVRNLEVMGQAVKGLTQATRDAHPEIPWKKIAATRDRVIHGYFRVDLEIVWEIVEKELPALREKIAAIADE